MSEHGTASGYSTGGCRCSDCSDAMRRYQAATREERKATRTLVAGRLVAGSHVKHGTWSTYNNWYCRCVACTEAYAATRPSRRGGSR